jgi:hypothetical protein
MKVCKSILISSASAIIVIIFSCPVLSQNRVAGIIVEIQGTTYWKKNNKTKAIKLDPRSDHARLLYVGEQVRSERNGLLRLVLCNEEKTISGQSSWFSIHVSSECPNRKAFEAYKKVGGRSRGDKIQIFSPSNHSVTTPEFFVIRWIPSTAKCTLTLAIREPEGRLLWEGDNVDGGLGLWDSRDARQALIKYRADGEEAPLLLRLSDSCANQIDVTFSLLSVKSETSLRNELKGWDKNDVKLMVYLGRASVFESYRLFPQAAEEYEAALKLAPESHDLLMRTIWAHRNTGNYARELELKSRLPAGTTLQ